MILTREDLIAIGKVVDEHVDDLRKDVSVLKSDVSSLKSDVSSLKSDVSNLKSDVSSLKSNVAILNGKVSNLENDMSVLKDKVTKIEVVQLENYLIPKVEEISSYQKNVYERYSSVSNRFEEKIAIIDTMDIVVKKHSEEIKKLQLKQA